MGQISGGQPKESIIRHSRPREHGNAKWYAGLGGSHINIGTELQHQKNTRSRGRRMGKSSTYGHRVITGHGGTNASGATNQVDMVMGFALLA